MQYNDSRPTALGKLWMFEIKTTLTEQKYFYFENL